MSGLQKEGPWELYYWAYMKDGKNNMVGRGEFVRLMFELAGVPYIDHGVKEEGGSKVFQFVRGGGNVDFPAFAPPVIKKGDFVLSQTPAIMKFLGKEFGFYPDNIIDEAHADSLNALVTDFVAEGRLVFHSKGFTQGYATQKDDENVKNTIAWFENDRLGMFLKYLEKALVYNSQSNSEGYLVGPTVTYVDIAAYHAICAAESQFSQKFATLAGEVPNVIALRDRISAIPNIAAYLSSDRRGNFAGDSMM